MKKWNERPHEERHLLNPAFCSTVLWYAAKGAADRALPPRQSLSFTETFLVLPLVLHQQSRESLPKRINTSLPVWMNLYPLLISGLPMRAKTLVPHTKEAIIFGGNSQLFCIEGTELMIDHNFTKIIAKTYRTSSGEVRECMKKAEFVGKWFAHTGTPETIFTIFGIRP